MSLFYLIGLIASPTLRGPTDEERREQLLDSAIARAKLLDSLPSYCAYRTSLSAQCRDCPGHRPDCVWGIRSDTDDGD